MMEAIFQAPKRRAKIYESFDTPLPIPCRKDASEHQKNLIYKAEIINHHVIVRRTDHMLALYGKGYFGKGVLSRSRPEHTISERWEYIGDKCLPVICLSKYQKHVRWAHSVLLAQGLDEEVVNDMLQKLTYPIELDLREEPGRNPCSSEENQEPRAPQTPASFSASQDQSMEEATTGKEGSNQEKDFGAPAAELSHRQGNPLYDPLSELYPQEPESVDPAALTVVKCRRHDDWIIHCGCWPDESQMASILSNSSAQGHGLSGACDYVLVEELDEEDSGDPNQNNISNVRTGKLVCRINPFNMMEYLQLSYEEAFFLVYALGCLSIYYDGEPLSVLKVWAMFRSAQPNFETTYAAYHYFRSRGWVPKSGIKYGADLMLYRKGPPFYHASYSVVVERVKESFQGAPLRPFNWRSFAALSRVTCNVSKELMLCYIIMPPDMRDEVFLPEFLKRVKVQELIVSRWISSRERMEQEEI
ncbi:tRNA-splicing endonuclease subunit Sen2 isoform X1 [Electrophorus electricus]|uniref:tRNA-splicing endonuclease subunit Sen2 n=1 Tax=Electrophorus electricus TaxID=8005 RepID=A0A4W4G2P1_ELEEL|nr:tRNA-splicing endonuclease subunit Sen2 isoform X1 [Electrophorus electricus]